MPSGMQLPGRNLTSDRRVVEDICGSGGHTQNLAAAHLVELHSAVLDLEPEGAADIQPGRRQIRDGATDGFVHPGGHVAVAVGPLPCKPPGSAHLLAGNCCLLDNCDAEKGRSRHSCGF